MIKQLLARRIASDIAVARATQLVCFLAACLIPVMFLRKFSQLELTEPQLLLGVLSTMSPAVLFAVVGILVEPTARLAVSAGLPVRQIASNAFHY